MAIEMGSAVKTTTRTKAIHRTTKGIPDSTKVNPEAAGAEPPEKERKRTEAVNSGIFFTVEPPIRDPLR